MSLVLCYSRNVNANEQEKIRELKTYSRLYTVVFIGNTQLCFPIFGRISGKEEAFRKRPKTFKIGKP